MSSTDNNSVTADKYLDLHIEAARQQFDATSIEAAACRLCEKLALAQGTWRPSFGSLLKRAFAQAVGWASLAGAALLLYIAISFSSLFFPDGNGTALAQVQQWFTSFQTLQVETTIVEADTVTDTLTWFDESGLTRIESGGMTTIVNPEASMIYMLRPDGQNFAQPITAEMTIVEGSTEFLDLVQTFLEADRLSETRVIRGISAIGFKRESDEWSTVLWVDPSDNRPMMVEQENANGVTSRSVLSFNIELPENAFEVPEDMQLLEPR